MGVREKIAKEFLKLESGNVQSIVDEVKKKLDKQYGEQIQGVIVDTNEKMMAKLEGWNEEIKKHVMIIVKQELEKALKK